MFIYKFSGIWPPILRFQNKEKTMTKRETGWLTMVRKELRRFFTNHYLIKIAKNGLTKRSLSWKILCPLVHFPLHSPTLLRPGISNFLVLVCALGEYRYLDMYSLAISRGIRAPFSILTGFLGIILVIP